MASVGCAYEYLGAGNGYRQYVAEQAKWCSHCNRIFCLEHAKEHKREYKKASLHSMHVAPKIEQQTKRRSSAS